MNIRFDIHTHVGEIPASKRANSATAQVSPEQAAAYLKKYKITHTVVLYSDYVYLEELSNMVDTKLYGVKWLNDPEYDSLDQGRPLYYGVKIHSHRGTYLRDSTRMYGVDYSDGKIMNRLLQRLSPNEIVYMHMQGSSSFRNWANPRTMLKWACKYPHLKFIMGHAGSYGGGIGGYPPVAQPILTNGYSSTEEGQTFLSALTDFITNERSIADAACFTNYTHNLWLDTSVHTPGKADALKTSTKWCIGSDFPFGSETVYSFDNQIQYFLQHTSEEVLEQRFLDTVKFLETDVKELAYEHINNSTFLYRGKQLTEMLENGNSLYTYEEFERYESDEDEEKSESTVPLNKLMELSKKKTSSSLDPNVPRRGPGRPRTKPLPDPDTPKRGPGRPRIKPLPDNSTPNRGPGRPRTKPLPDPDTPKRGPGRPSLKTLAENVDLPNEELQRLINIFKEIRKPSEPLI